MLGKLGQEIEWLENLKVAWHARLHSVSFRISQQESKRLHSTREISRALACRRKFLEPWRDFLFLHLCTRWLQPLYGALGDIRPSSPETIDQAMRNVQRFVEHYNHVRLHSAIGYVTPADKLAGLEPKVEHHEGRGIRSCPIFPELRPILDEAFEIFGDKSEYVVAAPQYRAAANTAMGWKNSNLRTEMTRLLRRAGVSGWPRLFHSMRASRQTELQREFPLHVVCSWLGNSPRIAQQSYLLVTEDDFAKAAGIAKVMVEG
jgi:hypothetical protein